MSDWLAEDDEELLELDDDGELVEADDGSVVRDNASPPVEGRYLAAALDDLGTNDSVARDLITRVITVQQVLGDADPTLATLMADIERGLRVLFMEFHRAPHATLMGVLGRMAPAKQLRVIDSALDLLSQRRALLLAAAGDEVPLDEATAFTVALYRAFWGL